MSPAVGASTVDGLAEARQPLAVWIRRLALLAITLLVAASLTGWLGVRTATTSAQGGGYRLSVT